MKDLKCGDFVWSKIYGNGLVYSNDTGGSWGILFEGRYELVFSARIELFAKGDEVEAVAWTGGKKIPKGTFFGITDNDCNNCKLIILCDKKYYEYVIEIKHKPIDKLEVILTLNGKEIDAKDISKETWEHLRRIE